MVCVWYFLYGSCIIYGYQIHDEVRHNRYQQIRTVSVTFFQLVFAWILPAFMLRLYNYEPYLTYFWPLDYDAIFPANINYLLSKGNLGQLCWYGV
jgi:ferredoxin-type protein NapH